MNADTNCAVWLPDRRDVWSAVNDSFGRNSCWRPVLMESTVSSWTPRSLTDFTGWMVLEPTVRFSSLFGTLPRIYLEPNQMSSVLVSLSCIVDVNNTSHRHHRDIFRLGILETWVLLSRCLDTEIWKSWSRVSVLVLKVLGLGLQTSLWLLKKLNFYFSFFHFTEKWNIIVIESIMTASSGRHGGLLRPNRARLCDRLLSHLVFVGCNNAMQLGVLHYW